MDWLLVPSDAGSVLMHADNGRVDHLHRGVTAPASALMILAQTPLVASEQSDWTKWCIRPVPSGT